MCASGIMHYGPKAVSACWRITPFHYHHYAELLEGIRHAKYYAGLSFIVCHRCSVFSDLHVCCEYFVLNFYHAMHSGTAQYSYDYLHGLTLIPAWRSNHIHYKV